jgi:tetratricopeptide (TPR) repeat protein
MRRSAGIAGGAAALWALTLPGCAAVRPTLWGGSRPPRAENSPLATRARQLRESAQAAIDRRDGDAALASLRALVQIDPGSAEAHHRLGRVYQAGSWYREAEVEYERALTLDKEYVAALTGLGTLYLTTGRPRDALAKLDAAIEIDPHQAEAHLARGRALETLSKPEDALAAYFKALECSPNSEDAGLRVATLQLARGEPDQALARLDQLVEQSPESAEVRHQRGLAQLALGHVGQAADDLKAAAAKLPDRADVHYHLALALASEHDDRAALVEAERALQLAPNDAAARALTEKLRR